MANNNFPIGIDRNPLVHSVFVRQFEEHGDFPPPPENKYWVDNLENQYVDNNGNLYIFNPEPPPPEVFFRITDDNSQRVTDAGDKRITD